MLPLNLTAEDGPRYVNAKQYQRILTRLKCRAKAKSENFGRARKVLLLPYGNSTMLVIILSSPSAIEDVKWED